MKRIRQAVKDYYSLLRSRTSIAKDKGTGWYMISFLFIGLYNDGINLYLKEQEDGSILLSDDGETAHSITCMNRNDSEFSVCIPHGVTITPKGEITKVSSTDRLSEDIHIFVSAVLQIQGRAYCC